MTNQTTPDLLEEIAAVMRERPEDGFREFTVPDARCGDMAKYNAKEASSWGEILGNMKHVRRKKRDPIQACGMEWPAPEKKAPPKGDQFWALNEFFNDKGLYRLWWNREEDYRMLQTGQIYLSHADRDAAAEAIIAIQTGMVE